MKEFLKRFALFAALVALPASAWIAAVVALDHASYRASLKMPDGASVVVCGDSQTKDALDPALFPALFNFSNAASLNDQNLLRLKDVLDANPGKARIVLIDASPLKLGYDPTIPVSETAAARVHFLIHVYHLGENVRPVGSWTALVRDVLFTRKFNEFRKSVLRGKRWRSSLAGGFDPDKTHGFTDAKYRKKALSDVAAKAERINSLPPATGGEELWGILAAQIALVRERGATPVLTTMPLSGPLLAAVDAERLDAFTAAAAAFAAKQGIAYLDFLRNPTDDEDWHDANHLNRSGAARFTAEFVGRAPW